MIEVVFVQNAHDDTNHKNQANNHSGGIKTIKYDKFALYAFHWLTYHLEINSLFFANALLGIIEYNTHENSIKKSQFKSILSSFFQDYFGNQQE